MLPNSGRSAVRMGAKARVPLSELQQGGRYEQSKLPHPARCVVECRQRLLGDPKRHVVPS